MRRTYESPAAANGRASENSSKRAASTGSEDSPLHQQLQLRAGRWIARRHGLALNIALLVAAHSGLGGRP
jgi:hypothetical protein